MNNLPVVMQIIGPAFQEGLANTFEKFHPELKRNPLAVQP
jgi:hypothetical protein